MSGIKKAYWYAGFPAAESKNSRFRSHFIVYK